MKTAISIPEDVFQRAEECARRLDVSRSALFTQAIREYLQRHREDDVTERLDAVYGTQESALDPVLDELQARSLPPEEWS